MGLHKYIFVAKLWTPFKAKKAIKASLDDIWISGPILWKKLGFRFLKRSNRLMNYVFLASFLLENNGQEGCCQSVLLGHFFSSGGAKTRAAAKMPLVSLFSGLEKNPTKEGSKDPF